MRDGCLPRFSRLGQPRGRRGNRQALAVGVSLAAHLLAGYAIIQFGYIAISDPPPAPVDKPIETTVFTLPKIVPETPKPANNVQVRTPVQAPYEPPVVLDVIPVLEPRPVDPGPLTLPTTPSATEVTGPPTSIVTPPIAPKPPVVIRNPAWLRQPTTAQMQSAYPYRAAEAGVSGGATLNCAVLPSGMVSDCRVTTQYPAGEGFGPAAIQMSRFFQLTPPMEDGVPVANARVVIPVNFRMPG